MSARPRSTQALLCIVTAAECLVAAVMVPLLVSYLHARHGFREPTAQLLLGGFIWLTYLGALPGGILVDRKLGALVGIVAGSALLAAGYGVLALDSPLSLWPGFALVVLGQGLFRPGEITMLGTLFPTSPARHELAFLWRYLGFQVASFLAEILTNTSVRRYDRQELFSVGALAMLTIALVLTLAVRLLPALNPYRDKDSVPTAAPTDCEPANQRRAIWLLCGLAVVFSLIVGQRSGSLVLFAHGYIVEDSLMRQNEANVLLPELLLILMLLLSIAGAAWSGRRGAEPSAPAKMMWGFVAAAAAYLLLTTAGLLGGDAARVSSAWLNGGHVLLCLAEVLVSAYVLSLATRVAAPGRTGRIAGLLVALAALGGVATSGFSLLWGRWPNHRYFALLALASLLAAVSLRSWRHRLQTLSARC